MAKMAVGGAARARKLVTRGFKPKDAAQITLQEITFENRNDPKAAQKAQADADASKTYAASFGKDPDFYDFYRAMQSYQTTFIGDGGERPAPTTIILSPQNDYLKEFTGRSR